MDLLQKARGQEQEAKILGRGKKTRPATKAHTGAEKLKIQAEALVLDARLEDLTVRMAEKVKTAKKGSIGLYLLDCLLERERKSAQRPHGKHQEALQAGGHAEGQEDEGGGSENSSIAPRGPRKPSNENRRRYKVHRGRWVIPGKNQRAANLSLESAYCRNLI
jgi:hypothetical protein